MAVSDNSAKLTRIPFTTSRMMEFLSRKELISQTGHEPTAWPLVALKELLDNALDACEEDGIAPEITVTVDDNSITVADNGPGIPEDVIDDVLDFSRRTSSREAYVAPDRGAQGNALKTLIGMPFALDGQFGRLDISARSIRHEIILKVDPIRQEPKIDHKKHPDDRAAQGTAVRIYWAHAANEEPQI